MKCWRFSGLAIGVLMSLQAHAAKPASPLMLDITPVAAIAPGMEATFTVTAYSQITNDDMAIRIHPLGSVKWGKGVQHWNGPVQRGVPKVMEFSIVAPKKGGFELHAVASMQGKSGGGFGARAVYIYEDPKQKAPKTKERMSTRHGKEVVEVPVR